MTKLKYCILMTLNDYFIVKYYYTRGTLFWFWRQSYTNLNPCIRIRIKRNCVSESVKKSFVPTEATTLVPECHVKWDWDGMWDGKRGFWLVSLVPPSQMEWYSDDWSCHLWAQISGRQTQGLTRGSPLFLYNKCGGLNPGFGVLRCGQRSLPQTWFLIPTKLYRNHTVIVVKDFSIYTQ
jgi:hypothetical protein